MEDNHVRNIKNIAMKKIIVALLLIILAGSVFVLATNIFFWGNSAVPAKNISTDIPATSSAPEDNQPAAAIQNSNEFLSPLGRATERVTKKPFGVYITPKTSPVQPEGFQGFHTGTDFEIFPEELNSNVPVRAICAGKIAMKKTASGYGSVLVQNCNLDNEPVTVIYGHIRLASISKKAGDTLSAGDEIGILGKAYSSETDGERKHLHLGIHKGSTINIRGYVNTEAELSGWIDACLYACK
ncbi:MAG: M23 family metallopeptidase [Candidatus Moraniibacteriota bacterium]